MCWERRNTSKVHCLCKRAWGTSKVLQQQRGRYQCCELQLNLLILHTPKAKAKLASQHPTHVKLKDLSLFFTGQLQSTRAASDSLQHLSHRTVLGELLARNILHFLLERPCVVE